MGEILFDIQTPLPMREREEDARFAYRGEPFREEIYVSLSFEQMLPRSIVHPLYQGESIAVGLDEKGREVREYTANFMSNVPLYAVSMLEEDRVTIWFDNRTSLWTNPNVFIWNFLHLETLLLRTDALVLHCSYLMYDGKAVLFSAPSGTGKTTQAKLWEKLYPARIINGDKAIIMRKNGGWYACGYPFHGSAEECFNESYPIRAIVIVRQNPMDVVETMRPMERLKAIYSETTVPTWNLWAVNKALDLLSDLVGSVTVLRQRCTMEDAACYVLHRALYGDE